MHHTKYFPASHLTLDVYNWTQTWGQWGRFEFEVFRMCEFQLPGYCRSIICGREVRNVEDFTFVVSSRMSL